MLAAGSLAELAGALAAWKLAWIAATAPVLFAIAMLGRFRARRESTDTYKRGALVHAPRALRRSGRPGRLGRCGRGRSLLRLGGICLTEADESKHFKLLGTTGTGKSTAIAQLLRAALARGDRAVITDPNGAYLERFFDRYRGDLVLNPFEPGSARWDLLGEIRRPFDCELLARSLIADCDDASGREWRSYARTFVASVARRCKETGGRELGELWRVLARSDSAELRRIVAGTPAQAFLDADNARMLSSIRSVTVSALAALEHVEARQGRAFSVRDWIERGRGVLFMPYRASQIAALRSLISTWMRLAIFETLSGPEEPRRLWFIMDELDALGAIDGLTDALARLRKFGGRCVIGFQSIAQVSSTYGAGEAETIIENCGNTLILRCSAGAHGGTSAFASRLIGEREVVRRQTSSSRDASEVLSRRGSRRSTQVTPQRVTETAVLASEIEQLPDLMGYLKTASAPRWTLIRLAPDVGPWPSSISA